MAKWGLIFGAVILAAILGAVYLIFSVGKFGFVKKLSEKLGINGKIISAAVMGVVFAVCSLLMSVVNGIIVLLHLVLFFLLFGLIMRIVRAVKKKDFGHYWQGILAVCSSAVYLAIGYRLCNNVWQTDYSLTTDKQLGTLKIVMFADSHLNCTFDGEGFAEHIETIKKLEPDIVLIPGDFVDDGTDRKNMETACRALGSIDAKYGVWFSYGNHDPGYSLGRDFTAEELDAELEKNGVHILKDKTELVDDRFYIIGRKDAYDDRADMSALTADLDKSKYMIVMDHQPNDYANEAAAGVDLVLSGHTHGGQLFPVTLVGEWLGMNDRTYGYERRDNTEFIVTSGISDWEILFKTGTKSEYTVITVTQK